MKKFALLLVPLTLVAVSACGGLSPDAEKAYKLIIERYDYCGEYAELSDGVAGAPSDSGAFYWGLLDRRIDELPESDVEAGAKKAVGEC